MCTVDMGAMGQVWVHDTADVHSARPFVDFNTLHMCRDFEAVRSWAEAHQIDADVPHGFIEPPGKGAHIFPEIP